MSVRTIEPWMFVYIKCKSSCEYESLDIIASCLFIKKFWYVWPLVVRKFCVYIKRVKIKYSLQFYI